MAKSFGLTWARVRPPSQKTKQVQWDGSMCKGICNNLSSVPRTHSGRGEQMVVSHQAQRVNSVQTARPDAKLKTGSACRMLVFTGSSCPLCLPVRGSRGQWEGPWDSESSAH